MGVGPLLNTIPACMAVVQLFKAGGAASAPGAGDSAPFHSF